MNLSFPYRIFPRGLTSTDEETQYVRGLIEQVLFTMPGERVNRPDFGVGVQRFVFEGVDSPMANSLQFLVQGELQRWLSDFMEVESVQLDGFDSTISVRVQFKLPDGSIRVESFRR